MKNQYNRTIYACFVGYIVQAIVNNFVPLLFLTFRKEYGIPLANITLLVTFNFGIQLLIDLLSVYFVDRIGYRISVILAHLFSGAGLLLLTILPELLPDPFTGILISVAIYALGGGLLEVIVSPVVEACPSDNKEAAMSMLHSFYCWGHVCVVLLSTLFFHFVGISSWKLLAVLWSLLPFLNLLAFTKVPIASLTPEGETGMTIKQLCAKPLFWLLILMMLCAGASEQAVSQWVSAFAEMGLGIDKTIGDLAGTMSFAVLMGISRAFYGKFGAKINLNRFMIASSVLCIAAYLCISIVPIPVVSLIGCAVCGLSVGIMWPGTFSRASASLPAGGTAMFALLALGGDLGCSAGPTLVGFVSDFMNGNLKAGILVAVIFPIVLLVGILLCTQGTQRIPAEK